MIPIKLNTLPGLESLPDAVTVRGNPHPVPFSPPIDPDHVFSVDVVRPILGWMLYDSPDMLLLFGDRGLASRARSGNSTPISISPCSPSRATSAWNGRTCSV